MQEPKTVRVDGIETSYYEAGKGRPMVLVHGGQIGSTYNAFHWSLNFDELAKQFHVYALDKLGQGHTGNPVRDEDYTMAATIAHVHAFLKEMEIEDGVLVGHSRGALPIARIAMEDPGRVSALIIFDTNTLAPEDPSTPTNFYELLEVEPPISEEEYVRREPEANSYSPEHVSAEFVQAMVEIVRLEKTKTARTKMRNLGPSQFLPDVKKQRADTLAMIGQNKLMAPTLIIWGFNDPSAPVKLGMDLLNLLAPTLERTQFHIFNCAGHYAFREHADEINRLITSFVSENAM